MATTLAGLLRDELIDLLAPLATAGSPLGFRAMLESFGHTDRLAGHAPLRAALAEAAALVAELSHIDDAALATWDGVERALVAGADAFAAVRAVEQALTDPTLADQATGLGQQIIGRLVALHLRTRHPRFHRAASLLTLIAPAEMAPPTPLVTAGSEIVRMPRADDTFRFDRAGDLVVRPGPTLRDAYFPNGLAHVADAYAAADLLFPLLGMAAGAIGLRWYRELFPLDPPGASLTGDPPLGDHSSSDRAPDDGLPTQPIDPTPRLLRHMPRLSATLPGTNGSPLRLGVGVVVSSMEHDGGIAGAIVTLNSDVAWSETRGAWKLDFESDGKVSAFVIGPAGVTLAPLGTPQTDTTGRFSATLAAPADGPVFVFGSSTGTRLEVGGAQITVEAALSEARQSLALSAAVSSSAIVIAPSDVDGFLSSFLPADGLRTKFDLGLEWSTERGLTFHGAAGLDATLAVGLSIGDVLAVPTLYLGLHASDTGLQAEVSATLGLSIGPVLAVIDRVGITTAVTFPEEGGNLGVVDLALDFKGPSGAGITIDSPFVTGGGFFSFDQEKGQYAGVIQLNIEGGFTVTAIGLIATRLPNGAKGFSLLVLITAEDFQPIPLGLGFTLAGIGGLLAINRTCNAEVLREGIKNQTLSNILFPHDPIRNAPQIISSLNAVFPPQSGSYLFGPVVRINWGTPPVLTMDLGLVLEFGHRTRLLVLGRVSAILPSEKYDLIHLQMNIVGIVDFDQKSVSLDAVLYDSRLLGKFPLTGSMALRLHWGPSPIFALSIGGFHPAFKPPANFPTLERIAISLSDSTDFRLRAESYLAITANTVQFGAHVEMYARAGGFSIEGMYGYDVLIQFDPFAFVADFAASVQLKHGSTNLFKVKVEGELSGPRPLHVKGKATFEIFWCDFSVGFDQTLIAGEPPPLPEAIRVLEKLKAALDDPRNWGGQLADGERRMVTLRDGQDTNDIALHPLGTLSVKQSVVPLGLEIAKFGQATPADAHLFIIDSISINGTNVSSFDRVPDFFAPAAFLELTDDEKLAAPSFEPMTAGVSLHAGGFITANDADLIEDNALRYETIIVDKKNNQPPRKLAPVTLNAAHLDTQIAFGAAARSAVRRTGTAKYRPAGGKNALGKGGWMIVSAADQSHQAAPGIEAGKEVSYAAAFQALRTLKQENPARAKGLMIMRGSEIVS